MKIIKTARSQYGWYIQLEDKSFKGCSEAVSQFLANSIPCDIDITGTEGEGKKLIVTRVKVLGKSQQGTNEFEQPKVERPFEQASEYKAMPNFYESQDKRQDSIVNQFCIREGIRLIEVFNQISNEKLKPTKGQVYTNAKIIREVYKALMNPEEPKGQDFPDY